MEGIIWIWYLNWHISISNIDSVETFLGGIHHCVTVVGKYIFYANFPFALPLTKENLDYCCINDNETKGINSYKILLKAIRSFTKYHNKTVLQKWNSEHIFDNINILNKCHDKINILIHKIHCGQLFQNQCCTKQLLSLYLWMYFIIIHY